MINFRIFFLLVCGVFLFSNTALMAGDFVDNGDGTVTDNNTKLMWQQGENGDMNWEAALTCCENLELAEYDDWRLPNVKELVSITEETIYNPAIDTRYFSGTYSTNYWSSSTDVSNTSYAWFLFSFSGYVSYHPKTVSYYVRCVRVGQ